MTNVIRDARIGCRLLWKNPGFASVAVLTFALGLAATTAIFSVIYATFFEALPYRDADRLVMVWSRFRDTRNTVSSGDFTEWKGQASVFDNLNAWTSRMANLSSSGRPEQVHILSGDAGISADAGLRSSARAGPRFP